MSMIDLGEFIANVKVHDNGLFDAYISHGGNSGEHYTNLTTDEVGHFVSELIETVYEGTMREAILKEAKQ